MDADTILVLSDGCLVQKGTHKELMQVEGGNYQRLMELEVIHNWSQLDCSYDDRRSENLSKKEFDMISTSAKVDRQETDGSAELSKIIVSTIIGHRITWAALIFPLLSALCCLAFNYGVGQLIYCYAALMAKADGYADQLTKTFGSMDNLWREGSRNIELLGLSAIALFIVSGLSTGWFNYFCEDFLHRLRIAFARKMLYSDAEFHDQSNNQPATLAHLLQSQSAEVREMLVFCLPRTISLAFDMIFCFALCFYICAPLALVSLVISFFVTLFKYAESKVMIILEDSNNKVDVTLLNESLHNARFVKSSGCQEALVRKFGQDSPIGSLDPNFSIYAAGIFGLSQIFCYFSLLMICRMSIRCVTVYGYSSGEMIVSQTVLLMTLTYLMTLNDNLTSIGRGLHGLRRIHERMNATAHIEADPANPEAVDRANVFRPKVKGKIEFRNVVFRYQGRCKNALNGMSFVLEPGQRLAVFGRSGAGKTTVIELLLRFYDPNQGEILIDDIDIRNFNLCYLRSLFSAFMQSPAIFQGSLKYNVIYNSRLADEGLSRVMAKARLQEFTDGGVVECDRQLRASGDNLSGGQRQRIALARVLGKTGQVFLFDEATSAVDKANEVEIMKELSLVSAGKTSIFLSTRATFMKEANYVLAIEGGNVVERGEFEELMAKRGFFYRFSK
jgi:ABC-type multidrug transport system fused ATPase/permease subunit